MNCNCCGKVLDQSDEIVNGNIVVQFQYGSKRDGDRMKFSICSDCIDKLTDDFIAKCKIKPKITTD